jgi:hypothetical protein
MNLEEFVKDSILFRIIILTIALTTIITIIIESIYKPDMDMIYKLIFIYHIIEELIKMVMTYAEN